MVKFLNNYIRMLLIFLTGLFAITGCNESNSIGSNGMNQASAYFGGKKLPQDTPPPLDVIWTIDGKDLSNNTPPANTSNLLDPGWHLLTLEVVNEPTPLSTPIPLQGLQSQFYPAPTDNKGESIQIVDINCKSAQFSKNGDTCSAYIKVSYDYIKAGISNPPTMYAQFAPINYRNLPIVYDLNVKPLLDRSQGDYRVVLPIENIGGSKVIANKNQYQILQMQNIAIQPLTIKTISNLTNPNFTLTHRTSAESTDQYYGNEQECSLTANPGLNQINQLESLDNTCILVYQAALSTTQTLESDTVSLATDASMTAPWSLVSNTFALIANYATGQPIPESAKYGANFTIVPGTKAHPEGTDMVIDSYGDLVSGTVATPYPFNLVNVSYDFQPGNTIDKDSYHDFYSNNKFNIAEYCTPTPGGETCTSPISVGNQLLTDGSTTNPVTVSQITEGVQDSASNPGNATSVSACGGAWTSSGMKVTQTVDLAKQNKIHMYIGTSSHALCGNMDHSTFEQDVPLYGYNNTVYNVDQTGCGGGNWDIGGKVTVTGPGCNVSGSQCKYTLIIEAWHGGTPGQCQDHQSTSFDLYFDKPQVYAQVAVNNFNPAGTINYLAAGGQNLSAWYGSQGAILAQSTNCTYRTGKPFCTINGVYQNGTSDMAMAYQAGLLQPGDRLHQGRVNFNRSEGYDLSNFDASHEHEDNKN